MAAHFSLNIFSYNATGIMTAIPYLLNELNNKAIDICGLSEHWLAPHNAYILNNISSEYTSYVKTCSKTNWFHNRCIGKGGVGFLWKNSLSSLIEPVEVDSDRLIAIRVRCHNSFLTIIQAYLPSTNHSLDEFKAEVDILLDTTSTQQNESNVVIIGDVNARIHESFPCTRMNSKDIYLSRRLREVNLRVITGSGRSKGASHSFYPYNENNAPSLIDHLICDELLVDSVERCCIVKDAPLNVSRHLPIFAVLKLQASCNVSSNTNAPSSMSNRPCFRWNNVDERNAYKTVVNTALFGSQTNNFDLDREYERILNVLTHASEMCISKRNFNKHLKPYWSKEIGELYKSMKQARITWRLAGKPENHLKREYKKIKANFRRKLRNAALNFEKQEYNRIDKLAEIDQKGFWKLVNSRKPSKLKPVGCEIDFEHGTYSDPRQLAEGWRKYFENLYSFTEDPAYDSSFSEYVDNLVDKHLKETSANEISNTLTTKITENEVYTTLKTMPNNKSASLDNLTYEHLKYAGHMLIASLNRLYNKILETESFPIQLKSSVIVTIHKGKGKSLRDPSSYRPITLTPVVLKLFEKILLNRIESTNLHQQLNPMQHGFQKGKSCIMASYIAQEARDYARERGSPIYCCYLDAKQAFDRVWINGLLHKLHNLGFRGKILRIISEMFKDNTSKTLVNGILSDSLTHHQGTKQGSILSPFFYIVFLDQLLWELEGSNHGLKIHDTPVCAPTQADDIVLLSLSRQGIEAMLTICSNYTSKWRYSYNPTKSAVMVMNANNNTNLNDFTYRHSRISCVNEHKHLGTTQTTSRKSPNTDDVKKSLRASFLSVNNSGVHPGVLNPLTAIKLYTTIALPRALYGCELWNELTRTMTSQLEVAHHFCLKVAQKLPHLTRSDMATSLVGCTSLEAYIDFKKLSFFGVLCRLRSNDTSFRVFNLRLFQCISNCTVSKHGFIPDLLRLLEKYNLNNYLKEYIQTGQFQCKAEWKIICKKSIFIYEQANLINRMNSSDDYSTFRQVHINIQPSNLWRFSLDHPDQAEHVEFCVKLLTKIPQNQNCFKCNTPNSNELLHLCFYCDQTQQQRSRLLTSLEQSLGREHLDTFINCNPSTLLHYMLGKRDRRISILPKHRYAQFLKISSMFICDLYV